LSSVHFVYSILCIIIIITWRWEMMVCICAKVQERDIASIWCIKQQNNIHKIYTTPYTKTSYLTTYSLVNSFRRRLETCFKIMMDGEGWKKYAHWWHTYIIIDLLYYVSSLSHTHTHTHIYTIYILCGVFLVISNQSTVLGNKLE